MDTPVRATRRDLPHLLVDGGVYFVTWRLHRGQHPLAPEERAIVLSALRHFDGDRYLLGAHVVMDDHVHVIVSPTEGDSLSAILHSWKSFTAHRLRATSGRGSPIWQRERHDRLLRNEHEYQQRGEYIWQNPGRRWPDIEGYEFVGGGLLDG